MGHNNRARLTISTEQSDIDTVLAQRAYHGHDNVVVVGTVARGTCEHGLLVQSTVTKQYWLWDGAYSSLDARKVNAALGIDGRVNNGGHKTAGAKRKSDTEKKEPFSARADGIVRDFFSAQNTSRSDTLRMLVDFYQKNQHRQSD